MMQNESRNHDGTAAVSFIYIIKYNISRHSGVLVEEKTLNLVLSYLVLAFYFRYRAVLRRVSRPRITVGLHL